MPILLFLIKFYIIVLLLRYFSTPQELYFNPLGKLIAIITDPLFKWSTQKKEQSDKYTFPIILLLIIFAVFMNMVGNGFTLNNVLEIYLEFVTFFMQLLIVAVLLGAVIDVGYASYYFVYFYRLSRPFVKFTSFFVRIKSKWIILPTAILIFILYLILSTPIQIAFLHMKQFGAGLLGSEYLSRIEIEGINSNYISILMLDIKRGLISLINLIKYYSYIIIARALLSWVSPDPRSPVVQVIFAITEPILAIFRRVIPPLGVIDISAMIAVFVTYAISIGLYRLVALI